MRVLVTGGNGFLGKVLVHQLLEQGDSVHTLQRSATPDLKEAGVTCFQGDLADPEIVMTAAKGCDVVYHVAAKAGVWGRYLDFHRANIVGTENVLTACRELGITRLVYTSSPSVVFDGKDESGIDESTPYPTRYLADYPRTKAIAEAKVLNANNASLATVALRPHLIWGPGDHHLFPRLVQKSRAGRLRRVGHGNNLVDTTYVDNAADAHRLAAKALFPGSAASGKAYFISNGEPMSLWELIDRMLACANEPPVHRRIGARAAYWIGWLMELGYHLTGTESEPPMTRFVARQLATEHWFRLEAARRDLGYVPRVTITEGLRRLKDDWREHSTS